MQSPDSNFDAEQDAELRAVSVPEGLLDRLQRTALSDDEGLDAALRRVPMPAGLVRRLRRSVLDDDDGLDAAIRNVPVPIDLPERLRQVPKHWIRLVRLPQWATAASLAIAIGLSYVGAILGLMMMTYRDAGNRFRPDLTPFVSVEFSNQSQPEVEFAAGAVFPDSREPDDGTFVGAQLPVPEIELVRFEEPGPAPLAEVSELFSASRVDALLAPTLFGWGKKLPPDETHDLPELGKVPGLIPRGIDPPPRTNLPFLIKHGVQPFVAPVASPGEQTGVVPLGVDSSSYELTRRYLEDGELTPAKDVRTEEFLAAGNYEFPQPKGRALGLSTFAGPSPFPGEGICMLQVGVQARKFADYKRRPARLVLAIDVSRSMRWGGRLEMIRRALSGVVRQLGELGAEDRISLVSFSEDADLLIEDAGREDADQLLAAVEWLSVESSTNVGAGLRMAYAVAPYGAASGGAATRVVLLTDGRTELDRGTADLIEQRLAEAARRKILLEVIDLGQEKEPDRQLASFARSGGGTVHRATNADQVRRALLEIITGRPQLVAADARLRVVFNPKTVLAYRLLGHEANPMAKLMPAHPEADFHAGRSATALYEIRLKPGGNGDNEVAAVELTWQEPGGGKSHRLSRKVRRKQFASSFVEAPLSLQQAVLVAQAAEVLRKSKFARVPPKVPPNSRSLALVLELAGRVDTRLYERPTFVEFISLVERAEEVK